MAQQGSKRSSSGWRRRLGRLGSLLAVALLAAACASTPLTSSTRRSSPPTGTDQAPAVAPTTSPSAAGCPNGRTGVTQAMSGRIDGCVRVGDLTPGRYHVRLDGVLMKSSEAAGLAKQGAQRSTVPRIVSLALSPASGTPGTTVTVTGTLASPVSKANSRMNLCWDGCSEGLEYDGVRATWSSPATFHASLVVPDAPWITQDPARVVPLQSGTVPIGVQCLSLQAGCGLQGSEAHAEFHLDVSGSSICTTASACAQLTAAPDRAAPGDIVKITGFAPLSMVIGADQPFVYQLHVAKGVASGPEVRFVTNAKGKGSTVVSRFGHANFTVLAAPSFASLGRVHLDGAAESDTVSPIAADPTNSSRVAWCEPGAIDITATATATPSTTVSTVPATAQLAQAGLVPNPVDTHERAPCVEVALAGGHREAAMAAFSVNPHGTAPPFALLAMVTTDGGRTWQPVPVPKGASETTFGGFRQDASAVQAVFWPASPPSLPASVAQRPLVEVTTDGGLHWSTGRFACPSSGPCVTFAPYRPGNCAMNGAIQPIIVSGDAGGTWTRPAWPQYVQACDPAELVPTGSRSMLLADSGSAYLLLRSSDAGHTWTTVSLPAIPGHPATAAGGAGFNPGQGGLVILPDGSLLAWITRNGATPATSWELLEPTARSWCSARAALGTSGQVRVAPEVLGSRLWWATWPAASDAANAGGIITHEAAWSKVRC